MASVVVFLLPDLRGGGAERVMIDLAHEFAELGHSVKFVLMRAEGAFLPEVRRNFSVVDLDTPRARNGVPALARYLRRARPDGLLAAMWPLTVMAPVAARLARYRGRVLVSEHGILSAQYAGWGRAHNIALRPFWAIALPMPVLASRMGFAPTWRASRGSRRTALRQSTTPCGRLPRPIATAWPEPIGFGGRVARAS